MARIVVASHLVRYPVGGYFSWTLQWLLGFSRLGHDVYLVEKAGWANACFDPSRGIQSDDCSYGTAALNDFLARFSLQDRWCYLDAAGQYHGMSGERAREILSSADLFVDMTTDFFCGAESTWMAEAARCGRRIIIDGEAGYFQMKLENALAGGETFVEYDRYYTVGLNIGSCAAPTAGLEWHPIVDPVVLDVFPVAPPPPEAPFTTVMSWQAHHPIEFGGKVYGQKDVEFAKFMDLPRRSQVPMEIAVAGKNVPHDQLALHGWRVQDSHAVTVTFDAFADYIRASRGEFTVCKNVFVATQCGWFSDRSAAYLASGRPVVMQDTGFSRHLPTGRGLFAVNTADEAATALEEIVANYERQSAWAREFAAEWLSADKVLPRLLSDLGIGS